MEAWVVDRVRLGSLSFSEQYVRLLHLQEALVEAAVEEEKRRLLEQREDMEKSADEIRAGFNQREALLEVR